MPVCQHVGSTNDSLQLAYSVFILDNKIRNHCNFLSYSTDGTVSVQKRSNRICGLKRSFQVSVCTTVCPRHRLSGIRRNMYERSFCLVLSSHFLCFHRPHLFTQLLPVVSLALIVPAHKKGRCRPLKETRVQMKETVYVKKRSYCGQRAAVCVCSAAFHPACVCVDSFVGQCFTELFDPH